MEVLLLRYVVFIESCCVCVFLADRACVEVLGDASTRTCKDVTTFEPLVLSTAQDLTVGAGKLAAGKYRFSCTVRWSSDVSLFFFVVLFPIRSFRACCAAQQGVVSLICHDNATGRCGGAEVCGVCV